MASQQELLRIRKDALVSALTQLSLACQDANRACIEFYAAVGAGPAPTINVSPIPALPAAPVSPAPVALAAQVSEASSAATAATPVAKKRTTRKSLVPKVEIPEEEVVVVTEPETSIAEDHEAEENGKKKKRKRVYDPDAPRRPQTVYFAYANEARKVIRDEFQQRGLETSNAEILKEVVVRWKSMTEEQKEPFKQLYQEQIKKYDIEKAAYLEQKDRKIKVEEGQDNDSSVRKDSDVVPPKKVRQKKKKASNVGDLLVETTEAEAVAEAVTVPPTPELTQTPVLNEPETPSKSGKKKKAKIIDNIAASAPAAESEVTVATPASSRKLNGLRTLFGI
ncbi:hypothetical protein V1514DRAFT_334285 [Lipomyces japonicus]|uniref:uncharacterized protein n=1 Tax=Lipomyces japonicus TaxID=56871 RepID=UPI0034CDDB9C